MWMDDLSKTSQKKMLGNAYIYYVDFLAFKFFFTTQKLGNFHCIFLWANITLKGTYLCFRVISFIAVKC